MGEEGRAVVDVAREGEGKTSSSPRALEASAILAQSSCQEESEGETYHSRWMMRDFVAHWMKHVVKKKKRKVRGLSHSKGWSFR